MSDITLNLVVLRSADLARAEQFYAALGLRLMKEQHGTGPEHLAAELGEAVFEIYPQGDAESTRGMRVGFRVPAVADAITATLSAGGTLITPAKNGPWGLRAVVNDPDGHRVELIEEAGERTRIALLLKPDKLVLVNNALNEVCNGIDIEDAEFAVRLGAPRTVVQSLLKRICSAFEP